MEIASLLDIGMFVTACAMLMLGFPVAFTLAGTALIFGVLGVVIGDSPSLIAALSGRIFGGAMTNESLIAVPLFVYMGVMLERSRVAEELLDTMGKLFGTMRGGLGISVTIVGTLLAASTGIVGATVVTMGLLSLPTMLKRGYDKSLACGSICAAGTLGQIIPPSIVLVILGDQITNAYQEAQNHLQQKAWAEGNFSFTPQAVSVGDLFAGALLPGLALVGLYITYQLFIAFLRPESSPPIPNDPEAERGLMKQVMHALIPPIVLIVAVLGSILAGIAPPTEAAGVGAIGATFLAGLRIRELGIPLDKGNDPIGGGPWVQMASAALAGILVGGILGAVIFLGTSLFKPAPLYTAIAGAVIMVTILRLGIIGKFFRSLDSGSNTPIYMGAVGLILCLVLRGYMDLRIMRDTIPTGDWIGIGFATIGTLLAAWGMAVAFYRAWASGILHSVNKGTLEISSMVFVILIGAAMFSLVFRGLGGDDSVHSFLTGLPGGNFTAILVVMITMFLMGFFLDFIEITFVVVPIVAPVLLMTGDVSPVWLAIMMAMNLQTSFLTPPFGFALFYLRGVAPPEVKTLDIYRGVVPFIGIQILAIATLWVFPDLSDWLPGVIFGSDFTN